MTIPSADTPLYNHPLPDIEKWLQNMGGKQNRNELNCWQFERPTWKAEICLEVEEITVIYLKAGEGGRDIQRAFKYSLSRQDIEDAVFAGP